MNKQQFIAEYLTNVKLKIHNRAECYMFQRVAFDMGIKLHTGDINTYIAYNITDTQPQCKGKSYAVDMTNLTINNKRGIQMTSFFNLEKDLKEITFDEFITEYHKMLNHEELKETTTPFD